MTKADAAAYFQIMPAPKGEQAGNVPYICAG